VLPAPALAAQRRPSSSSQLGEWGMVGRGADAIGRCGFALGVCLVGVCFMVVLLISVCCGCMNRLSPWSARNRNGGCRARQCAAQFLQTCESGV